MDQCAPRVPGCRIGAAGLARRAQAALSGEGDDEGIGLVELIVAVFILTVALVSLSGSIVASMASLHASRLSQEGISAATRALETARSVPYDLLAMRSPDFTAGNTYDPDGPGPIAAEDLVVQADGVIGADVYPYRFTAGTVTVETWVTEFDDAKRVTTMVTSTRGRPVTQSTIVADAQRGLPLAFRVTPPSGVRRVPLTTTINICVPFTLINEGAPDTYELYVPPTTGFVITFFHVDGLAPGTDQQLTTLTGDGYTRTPSVARDMQLPLKVCYRRTSALAAPTTFTFAVTVRSSSLPSDQRALSHELIYSEDFFLYLRHALNEDAQPAQGGQFTLSPDEPVRLPPAVDYDVDGKPGKYLRRGKVSEPDPNRDYYNSYRVTFDYAFTGSPTVIGGPAKLVLWTATREALEGGPIGDLKLDVKVSRVRDGTVTLLSSSRLSYRHEQAGFLRQSLSLSLADTTFQPGDVLRLQLACVDDRTRDCHLLYDLRPTGDPATQPAMSRLELKFR